MDDTKTDRKIKNLERQLAELSELFVKTDQELRRSLKNVRINQTAALVATEFTLATKLGITMDVVLKLLPPGTSAAIQMEIDARVAACPDTSDSAKLIATKLHERSKDEYG